MPTLYKLLPDGGFTTRHVSDHAATILLRQGWTRDAPTIPPADDSDASLSAEDEETPTKAARKKR